MFITGFLRVKLFVASKTLSIPSIRNISSIHFLENKNKNDVPSCILSWTDSSGPLPIYNLHIQTNDKTYTPYCLSVENGVGCGL